ncbi:MULTISPECIES: ATPase [unclassified Mycobacterium]|uniref:ATPase n=1 Tax=unclassified Mycobacterium TaxID=2642494 RepID=UPI0007FD7A8C|nr:MULTISPECIES: ATPase [unclassified Mycobacterium]OBH06766.1 ATPase [Mycobacterium sp. E2699]OBI56283.1 ATPase [Mycobacterium sp. E787]
MTINSGPNRFSRYTAKPPLPGQTGPTQRLSALGESPARPSRDRRTRRTVDLPLATHRALDVWQREAADRIGVARVTGQEVLSALIDQLLVDPKLSAQVTRAIQARR